MTSDGGSFQSAMAVYAPAIHVEMKSSGDLFGACVANTMKFGGDSDFHYDRSLATYGATADGTLEVTRLYWLDLAPPPR
jgi:hypothetical protein